MKVLLDTNIVIHREASTVINEDIGVLFRWFDNLHYTKCIHKITVDEIGKYRDQKLLKTIKIKLANYNVLKVSTPLAEPIKNLSSELDKNQNDINDTIIINEVYNERADLLITEDKKLLRKASLLEIADKVYTIDAFLEKVTAENQGLADYKVLAVQKQYFGNLNIQDSFFDSLKEDYPSFEKWVNRKSEETVYICRSDNRLMALLYLKIENKTENYADISSPF